MNTIARWVGEKSSEPDRPVTFGELGDIGKVGEGTTQEMLASTGYSLWKIIEGGVWVATGVRPGGGQWQVSLVSNTHLLAEYDWRAVMLSNDLHNVRIWNATKANEYPDDVVVIDLDDDTMYRRGKRTLIRLPDVENSVERNNERHHGPGYYVLQLNNNTFFMSNGADTWTNVGATEPTLAEYPEMALDATVQPSAALAGEWHAVNPRKDVTMEDFNKLAGISGDDSESFNLARDAAERYRVPFKLLGKTYNFYQNISAQNDSFVLTGSGRRRRINEEAHGSVLKSWIVTGTAFTFAGNACHFERFSINTVTDGIAVDSDLHQLSPADSILVSTRNAAVALRLGTAFTQEYNMWDLYNLDENESGLGIYHDTATEGIAGGNLILRNMQASHYKVGIELGQEAANLAGDLKERRNVKLENCQARYGSTNCRLGNGYGSIILDNPWFENGTDIDLQIHSSASTVIVRGGQFNSTNDTRYGVLLGHEDPALNTEIGPVSFQGTRFRASGPDPTPTIGAAIMQMPSATQSEYPYIYHSFDMCEFINNGGRLIRCNRNEGQLAVVPVPVRISRPVLKNPFNGPIGSVPNLTMGYDENDAAYNDYITYS